ncbi:hypothetical protein IOCL2690_000466100 [Leishmania lindenbergi]|uniref:Uncharacterized protein n=1 Tax=Leishmania lindenbergi TaxID=651832 RepID=A0AAW3ADL8_9TRYP
MRNPEKDALGATLSSSNPEAAAASPDRKRRGRLASARLRLEQSMKTTRQKEGEEKDLLNTTVLMSNRQPLPSESDDQGTPPSIHRCKNVSMWYLPLPSLPLAPLECRS